MLKFLSAATLGLVALLGADAGALAGDADAGKTVFKKCQSCHAVGEGAKNRVGPVLNDLIGRSAGTVEAYKYSNAMIAAGEGGLVWEPDTLAQYLHSPREMIKGTKMAFAGLKSDTDIDNLISYLETFSSAPAQDAAAPAPVAPQPVAEAKPQPQTAMPPSADIAAPGIGAHFGLGRRATDDEIAAWNFDIRPDGLGLPEGHGTVAEGTVIYDENCAACHGDFGEGAGRWPVLAGGQGTLKDDRPVKTIGSYWPYLSTVYDYIHRAMPFGNAGTLSDNDYYALTAYLLYLNDIVTDEDFELNKDNFTSIQMPNQAGFIADNRADEAHNDNRGNPCMSDCLPGTAKITMHAAVFDVTPNAGNDESGGGAID